jgi:hypothetical protein
MNYSSLILPLILLFKIAESYDISAHYQRIYKGDSLRSGFLSNAIAERKVSASTCSSLCSFDSSCLLTFYVKDTKMCYLFDALLTSSDHYSSGSMDNHIINQKTCNNLIFLILKLY